MVVCRDCLHEGGHAARCPACGSPRLLADPGPALAIAHVDCDAFYAAVEKRDYPELRDKPVIVGGGRRGVVTTACYVARIDGVRSAMPMFKALTACPHAVVVKPRMDRYVEVGREVRRLMRDLTPAIEPVSIDEAFLDLSGTDRVHGASPAVTLVRFAHRVEAELGITVSVGLAPNKFLAKVASDLEKPRGFTVIRSDEARTFLAERTVGIIPGIGAAAQARLARAGIVLIRHLTERPAADLAQVVGRDAERLRSLAVGVDGRPVRLSREAKGGVGGNHAQRRSRRLRGVAACSLAPERAGRPTAEALGTCRTQRHAEAQEPHVQAPHARPLRAAADAARHAPLRGGAASPARRMRRHDLPPHRDRRVRPLRWRGG
jgi:DNA polymerase IV